MMSLRKLPALAMLALYLQAAFVWSEFSVIITDDGTVQIESAAAHLVHWHGSTPRSASNCGYAEIHGDASHGLAGHTHLQVTDSAAGSVLGRAHIPAPRPTPAPPVARLGADGCGDASETAGPHLSTPPPDSRYAAAIAAFARTVLLV